MQLLRVIGASLVLTVLCVGCVSSPRFTMAKPAVIESSYTEEGVASYYAEEFHGRTTSNGEQYDMNAMTAAHRTLPFGTKVKVTNRENGKSVIVRINDRGPFKDDRLIDLSYAAAKKIELVGSGTAAVKIELIDLGENPASTK